MDSVWKKSYLRKSLCGCAEFTVHQLFANTLKILKNNDEEDGRPLGFKADSYHDAGGKTEQRDNHSGDAPLALDDESKEQEDKEHSTGKQEVFFAVSFTHGRESSEEFLPCNHCLAEDHDETANNAQIAKEEVEIENETVTETLNNDYTEETSHSILSIAFRYYSAGSG